MVDAQCSERCEATHGGSNPPPPTYKRISPSWRDFLEEGDLNLPEARLALRRGQRNFSRSYRRLQPPPPTSISVTLAVTEIVCYWGT